MTKASTLSLNVGLLVSLRLLVKYFTSFVVIVVECCNFANPVFQSTVLQQFTFKKVLATKDNTPSMPLTEAHLEGFFILYLLHANGRI